MSIVMPTMVTNIDFSHHTLQRSNTAGTEHPPNPFLFHARSRSNIRVRPQTKPQDRVWCRVEASPLTRLNDDRAAFDIIITARVGVIGDACSSVWDLYHAPMAALF